MAPHEPGTPAPGPGGPGGSSGREQRAGKRTVPGTASAREGYDPGTGTAAGDPLTGVEADRDEADRDEESGGPDRPEQRG
ncbi:hypothetical protein Kpho02_61380 [Kitasatospora phosalacinea]|uniref:Uncharacterized protein n=1 Tax=Kitasatospora phosalacinea TaxID=2065 RepID=A0A9W6QCC6_9ACTN|nr:hypothetical protein [Kitasatospora phosalacinea]GLW73840.1 hypothetical protein Kpho02_61380 [Kitasatospora phosalacinea]